METPIGHVPKESGFIAKYRKHQGWWRTFVLNLPEGKYYNRKTKKQEPVCNRITGGKTNADKKNFLSTDISTEVVRAQEKQLRDGKGIMEADRLYNNLLSSQPLAFNFFGFFRANPDLALAFMKTIRADIVSVEDIVFEYAPESSQDGSAFDFGFVVSTATEKGFIGFECKYTDAFSYRRSDNKKYYGEEGDKNFEYYHQIYLDNNLRFPDEYPTYIRDKNFNQLFRNELLSAQMKPNDFVITGLFCHHDDKKSCSAGLEFQKKIGNGENEFILLTYADYFERMQKLNLKWETREFVMMLWARYCGLGLSKNIILRKCL